MTEVKWSIEHVPTKMDVDGKVSVKLCCTDGDFTIISGLAPKFADALVELAAAESQRASAIQFITDMTKWKAQQFCFPPDWKYEAEQFLATGKPFFKEAE